MTSDIEKLIKHNEELLSIKDELRSRGIVNVNGSSRLLNSNRQFSDRLNKEDANHSHYPTPLLFVSLFLNTIFS